MTYVCVKCGSTWLIGEPTAEPSGGLCRGCITGYARGKQRARGYHDCFARATEPCARTECFYHEACCKGLS